MAILLGALALLIALGGVIVHFAIAQTPATSVTQSHSSSTSSQNQGVKDYQKLYLQATSGTPIIDDPLNVPDSLDWLVDKQKCHFKGGALHIQPGPASCFTPNFAASNFAYQVQMTVNAGKKEGNNAAAVALVFRFNTTGMYFLEMTVDGSCGLGVVKALVSKIYLIPLHSCPAIHTGYHQTNLLTAIVRGSDIYVYINKQFVGTRSDDTYGSGLVGVLAAGTALDTTFQNAQVWLLT